MTKYFFVFSLLLIVFGLYVYPLGDPDVFIHLREGKFYAENGIATVNDPFAYTRQDQPLKQSEWLFQAGLYFVWKIGGYNLLILLKALLITLAFSLVGILVYRRWPKVEIAGLIMGLAVVLPIAIMDPLLRFFQERPYIMTFIFIPLLLLLLDYYVSKNKEKEQAIRKWLYTLPFLTIVWVNLHPGFIVTFIFLFAHIVEEGWRYYTESKELNKKRLINLLIVTSAVFLCGAINPMGFAIYPYIFKTTFSGYLVTIITEWQKCLRGFHKRRLKCITSFAFPTN